MPGVPEKAQATAADIQALPAGVTGEIIGGELHTHSRPSFRHLRASGRLYKGLDTAFDEGDGGPGGWIILAEPEIHLGEDIFVPDIAGWKRERLPAGMDTAFSTLAPDWLCEVLSPSTVSVDRVLKFRRYRDHNVRHLWYLDPAAQTLEVFRLEGGRYVIVSEYMSGETVRAEPFEAIAIDLSRLWRW